MPQHIKYHGHDAVVETGSKQHHGRKLIVWHTKESGVWHTHSTNLARAEVENHLNRNLSKRQHVDHIDNDSHHNGLSNLQVLSQHDNIAKEDKARAGKRWEK